MINSTHTRDPASSSREFAINFQLAPPAAVRPGANFTLPVIVSIRHIGTRAPDPDQQLVLHASLRNEDGSSSATGLTGDMTDNVHSRDEDPLRGYAKFEQLAIQTPGRYRLRVWLGLASQLDVTTRDYVESGVIHVHDQAEGVQRPTSPQIATLRRLTTENLRISEEDIQTWQNAA